MTATTPHLPDDLAARQNDLPKPLAVLMDTFGVTGDVVFALPGMGPVLRRCFGDHGGLFDDENEPNSVESR